MLNKIRMVLAAYCLTSSILPLPADANPSPSSPTETKVHTAVQGLESKIDGETLQHGFWEGKYRADTHIILNNGSTKITKPINFYSSVCVQYGDWSACLDGDFEKLNGIPKGELRRPLHFETRAGEELNVDGKKVKMKNMKAKITLRLEQEDGKILYRADHFLTPIGNYDCKGKCP